MARAREHIIHEMPDNQPRIRCCDQPGCTAEGSFRAPRSRDNLGALASYFWFCLEHVRAYNASWNYYAGMSEPEIERDLRHDTVWQRPTWPLGWRIASRFKDPLGIFGHEPDAEAAKPRRVLSDEEKALLVFELDAPFSLIELKTRYKLLVKRHHPDANGGDKAAEERLKVITQAYALLKARFFS